MKNFLIVTFLLLKFEGVTLFFKEYIFIKFHKHEVKNESNHFKY